MTHVRSTDSGSLFRVTRTRKDVVKPALPTAEHWLPQSNLDLLLPPADASVYLCYDKKPDAGFDSVVADLKKSLAECLVAYYPFAGEVVRSPIGEPEVWCNDIGAEFVEAYADVELREIGFYKPDESVEGRLVPKRKAGVLAVQVTELKCGSLVVGCTFDHRVADAYSANMFLVAWSGLARSGSLLARPSFRRSVIGPRRPPHFDPQLNNLYMPISTLPPRIAGGDGRNCLVSRMYYITADRLAELQASAITDNVKRTKFVSFSAFLWRMVAMSSYEGDGGKSGSIVKMGIVVDGRTRLDTESSMKMTTYFGNVLSIPFGEEPVSKLREKSLTWAAEKVNEFLTPATTKDHFLDLIDMVETWRPEPLIARFYCPGPKDGAAFVVSSGQRFPIGKLDFGWGRPRVGSYHFPCEGDSGYVMPMPSPAENGGWVVYMQLTKGQVEFIEENAAHVFKPFTLDGLPSR